MIHFAEPKVLLLLWLVPLLGLLILWELRAVRKRMQDFIRLRMDELLVHPWSYKRAAFKSVLLVLAIVLLILALARPRWDYEWRELKKSGADIVVALDLSTSMLATDISPNRLERAKREIIDLLALLKGDRIGIVAFAGVAFVYTPLTLDYRLVDLFLKQLDLTQMPVQGTAIGEALKTSLKTLEKASDANTEGKSILLITDGEDESADLMAVAREAKEKGVRIYSIGIGSELGAPIPLPEGGFKKDEQGRIVVTKLGESVLQHISAETGGLYIRSSTGNLDLETIYKHIRAKEAGEGTGASSKQKIWNERFSIFLALALFLLIFEFFMSGPSARKKRWWYGLSLLVFLNLAPTREAYANARIEAEKAFQRKDYEQAAEKFLEAEQQEPEELKHSYNKGVAHFHRRQFDKAEQAFARAVQSPDAKLSARSWFNLGNTHVSLGKLEEAIQDYEKVLSLEPENKEARENLEWAKRHLEKQKQEEQQNQEQEQKHEEENKEQQEKQSSQDKKPQDSQEQKKEEQKQERKEEKNTDPQEKQESKDGKSGDSQKEEQQNQEQKKEDSSESESKEESQNQEQKDPQKQEQEEDQQGSSDKEKREALSPEEAEKLLRRIRDREGGYGMRPHYEKPRKPPKKDW